MCLSRQLVIFFPSLPNFMTHNTTTYHLHPHPVPTQSNIPHQPYSPKPLPCTATQPTPPSEMPTPSTSTAPMPTSIQHLLGGGAKFGIASSSRYSVEDAASLEGFEITGATEYNAAKVNGTFVKTGEMKNNKPVYLKVGSGRFSRRSEDGDCSAMCCWYTQEDVWFVGYTDKKDANKSSGYAHSIEAGLVAPGLATQWAVSVNSTFVHQPAVHAAAIFSDDELYAANVAAAAVASPSPAMRAAVVGRFLDNGDAATCPTGKGGGLPVVGREVDRQSPRCPANVAAATAAHRLAILQCLRAAAAAVGKDASAILPAASRLQKLQWNCNVPSQLQPVQRLAHRSFNSSHQRIRMCSTLAHSLSSQHDCTRSTSV